MSRKKRKAYVNYDYDALFTESINREDDKRIEELLKSGRIKGVYATKMIKAGKQVEFEIYPEFTRKEAEKLKVKKVNLAQKNLNEKNARKRVARLIENNFVKGDYWETLTYTDENIPKSMDEAIKNMQNYIKRINYRRKKKGLETAKYIYITEWKIEKVGEGIRCHHHLLIDSGLSMDEVEKTWKLGRRNNIRRVYPDENGLAGLAQYLTKDPKGRKRWCGSKNLKQPTERKSYTVFRNSHIKKIISGQIDAKDLIESKYKQLMYLYKEIKYNEKNGRYYIYIRARERWKE